jgi:hypothetical protein
VKQQRFVGTGYFDSMQQVITSGTASNMALHGPAEEEQFTDDSSVELAHDHGITTPLAMVGPLLADPSKMSNGWQESDELMRLGD